MANFTWEANKIRVFIGGVEFHLLSDVSAEESTPLERISGIGDFAPRELTPTEISYRVSLSGYVEKTTKAVDLGLWYENPDAALNDKDFSVEIFNRSPAILLRKYEGAKAESANMRLGKHQQMLFSMTLQGLSASGRLNAS